MSKALFTFIFVAGVLSLFAELSSVLPADRLALANQLSRRGLHAEALKEYEAIRNETSVPQDEVCFKLGETCRALGRTNDAFAAYGRLLSAFPASRFTDYARLNRALLLDVDKRALELRQLDRDGTPASIRATALYYLGETSEAGKDVQGAVGYYARSAAAAPTNEVARLALLKSAALLSDSEVAADRRRALITYLDLADASDARLASEALFSAAMLSYREGRYENAAELFRRLAKNHPDGARTKESVLFAAWSNYLAGRYAEALALASPLRSKRSEDAWYLTASSLRNQDRPADALQAYNEALTIFPGGRFADAEWFERLTVLASESDHGGVLAELAARGDPPTKTADRAWSYGCEAAIAVTNFPLAVEYARLVAKQKDSPLAPNAVHRLAWLHEKSAKWDQAAAAYRRLADAWPSNTVAPQALFQSGVANAKAGRPEQSRSDWTTLLARYPSSDFAPEALYMRAMEELRAKEFRAADRSLDELMRRFPKTPHRPEALYWWGVAAIGAGDDPEAERHFREALTAKPTAEFNREIRLELASLLQKRGADREAADLFESLLTTKAVDRLPPTGLIWLAESLLSVSNNTSALVAAEIVEKRNVDAAWNQTGSYFAGVARERLGERDAAVAAYTRALASTARTPAGARAALALGRLKTEIGDFDEAKKCLADAVERAHTKELLPVRVQAYAALAANEEARGDAAAALGYHMLVGTLFDDPETVPHALVRAAAILREQGRIKEAEGLLSELQKRYPKAVEKGRKIDGASVQ